MMLFILGVFVGTLVTLIIMYFLEGTKGIK